MNGLMIQGLRLLLSFFTLTPWSSDRSCCHEIQGWKVANVSPIHASKESTDREFRPVRSPQAFIILDSLSSTSPVSLGTHDINPQSTAFSVVSWPVSPCHPYRRDTGPTGGTKEGQDGAGWQIKNGRERRLHTTYIRLSHGDYEW